MVSGALEAYVDPDCGCRLRTTFEGRLDGDRIEGTFSTLHVDTGTRQRGVWEVTRDRD